MTRHDDAARAETQTHDSISGDILQDETFEVRSTTDEEVRNRRARERRRVRARTEPERRRHPWRPPTACSRIDHDRHVELFQTPPRNRRFEEPCELDVRHGREPLHLVRVVRVYFTELEVSQFASRVRRRRVDGSRARNGIDRANREDLEVWEAVHDDLELFKINAEREVDVPE